MHLWKKSTQKLSWWKEILSWMIWDFSVIQQKHALTWPGLYRLIFQSLYDTSLISPRWEIDETVNFRNFRKLFTKSCAAFLGHFGTLFSNGKNETKWQGTWSMLDAMAYYKTRNTGTRKPAERRNTTGTPAERRNNTGITEHHRNKGNNTEQRTTTIEYGKPSLTYTVISLI